MKNNRLSELLTSINAIKCTGSNNKEISSLIYDSREVIKGSLFFALKGIHTDGHNYIDKAIESGAVVIIHSDDLDEYNNDVDYVKVENCRMAMSPLSSAFYDFPSKKLKIIGVTGTDGKSTTVSMIHQLLELCGKQAGFISTVNYKTGDSIAKSPIRQSTPEAPTIHKLLSEMIENGKEYAVLESTSHGLSYKTSRLKDVDFNGAVLTNVTQEHLEFHGTLEQYRDDKANLFRMASDFAIINYDDENHILFDKAAISEKIISYISLNKNCNVFAYNAVSDSEGPDFEITYNEKKYPIRLNVPGLINIENIMVSLAAVHEITGIEIYEIIKRIPQVKSVKGRMALIKGTQPFDVYVDYAHTPGAYKKVFPLFRKATEKKLITLFGSGGERDIDNYHSDR
jgi:UDP-N-acetylmuramoyl-L-alanyl-D-glutamate--2,6-diaminopimelate ligase